MRGTGQAANLHLHQPPGGIRDHVAQNIRVRGLLDQRAQVHHGIGHRGSPGSSFATQTYPKTAMTTRAAGWLPQRYIESAQPASSATVITYTTSGDATSTAAQVGFVEAVVLDDGGSKQAPSPPAVVVDLPGGRRVNIYASAPPGVAAAVLKALIR